MHSLRAITSEHAVRKDSNFTWYDVVIKPGLCEGDHVQQVSGEIHLEIRIIGNQSIIQMPLSIAQDEVGRILCLAHSEADSRFN